MTSWITAGLGLSVGLGYAILGWLANRWRAQRDTARRDAADDRRRLDEVDRFCQQSLKRQEETIRVLRNNLDRARSDLAAVATAHPDLADEYLRSSMWLVTEPTPDVPRDDVPADTAAEDAGGGGGRSV